jgi:parallel beta-helix repeat protein
MRHSWRWILVAAGLALALQLALLTPAAHAATCSRVAAPWGSDRARGSAGDPYRTARKLARSLGLGQTGCLRQGTYFENVSISHGGLPLLPVTLRNFPGEGARIVGRLHIPADADHVRVSGLYLDGSSAPGSASPTFNSDDVTFSSNDVSNRRTSICFAVGNASYGASKGGLIESNRIHDCGVRPPTNAHHGIYLAFTSGVTVRRNWIYDNADRGIQLYPSAQGTEITGNVIDGNGEGVIFSGADGVSSSDNVVERNIITNSTLRGNVESYYPPGTPDGQRNTVRSNCVWGGARDRATGGVQTPSRGFLAYANLIADPRFANRAARDYRLSPDSPCLTLYGDGSYVPGPGVPAPPLPTSPASQLKGSVSLRVRPRVIRRSRRLRLTGRARGIGAVRGQRVYIERRRRGRWRRVLRTTLRADRSFSLRRSFRVGRRTRALRLRARVRGVGRSRSVRVAVRRRSRS